MTENEAKEAGEKVGIVVAALIGIALICLGIWLIPVELYLAIGGLFVASLGFGVCISAAVHWVEVI